jgi:hypothetical protein
MKQSLCSTATKFLLQHRHQCPPPPASSAAHTLRANWSRNFCPSYRPWSHWGEGSSRSASLEHFTSME